MSDLRRLVVRRVRPRSRPVYNRVDFRRIGWTFLGRQPARRIRHNTVYELNHLAKVRVAVRIRLPLHRSSSEPKRVGDGFHASPSPGAKTRFGGVGSCLLGKMPASVKAPSFWVSGTDPTSVNAQSWLVAGVWCSCLRGAIGSQRRYDRS